MSHDHDHPHSQPPAPPVDSGAQALSAALHSSFGIVKFVMLVLFVVFLFFRLFHGGAAGEGDYFAIWQTQDGW